MNETNMICEECGAPATIMCSEVECHTDAGIVKSISRNLCQQCYDGTETVDEERAVEIARSFLREKFSAAFEHANAREGQEAWIVRLTGTSVGEYHKAIVVVTSTGKIHAVNCHRAPQ